MIFKRILKSIFLFFRTAGLRRKYPHHERISDVKSAYISAGLGDIRDQALEHLNSTLEQLNLPHYSENNGMFSEHLLVFSALSLATNNIKNILEIGTHDGRCAHILSALFPESLITTIDLPDDDITFLSTYARDTLSAQAKFIAKRAHYLDRPNIQFIQKNSLQLTLDNKLPPQDLIWVDGAHGYPTVACDIINALHLSSKKSYIMCDDIWTTLSSSDHMYSSIASFQTLSALQKAGVIHTTLFLKRLGDLHCLRKKYVSLSQIII